MTHLATAMSTLTSKPGRLPSQTIQNPKVSLSMVTMSDMTEALKEDRHINGRTWIAHTDNGSVNSDGLKRDFLPNIYAPEQDINLEVQVTQENEERIKEQNDLMARKRFTWSPEAYLEMSKDPGAFTVTCTFGKTQIHHCLIDLGASVNILPYPLYYSLELGPLKPPMISLELGDKTCIQPVGVLESFMLRVGKIVVPTDFYVIPTKESSKDDPPTIILGRPFLYTTGAKINMGKGSLSLAFGGRTSYYNIYGDNRVKPLEPWGPDPSTSPSKRSSRINPGAEAKFDLSHPWDPNW
ncbi:unnamed protein product [Rhodiola kirilowii]